MNIAALPFIALLSYAALLDQTTRYVFIEDRPRCLELHEIAQHCHLRHPSPARLGQTTRHALNESRPRCLALISASVQCPSILNFAVGSNDPDSPPRWAVRVAWNHSPLLCASWLITWVKRPGLYPSGTGRVAWNHSPLLCASWLITAPCQMTVRPMYQVGMHLSTPLVI